jgi:hypothetical protein
MNTDFEFARDLLLAVERESTDQVTPLSKDQLGFSKIPDGIFYRNVIHFERAELLVTLHQKSELGRQCLPVRLTESGIHLLSEIRDDKVWQRILTINNGEVATFSLSVLIALAERVTQLKFKQN